MKIKYRLFSPLEVGLVWSKASPWIMQALADSRYKFPQELAEDLECIRDRLMAGTLMLWASLDKSETDFDLVFITEPSMYAGKMILTIQWLSGKLGDKLSDLGLLESWAKQHDFYAIHVSGRKGWEKKLKPYGYVHEFTTLSRVLPGVH